MEFREFTAGKDDEGRRLDRILRIFLQEKSLGEIYKLLRKGLIKLNQKKAKPDSHVNQGDIISIAEFIFDSQVNLPKTNTQTSEAASAASKTSDLNIIFENQHLLIINKPYGRSVHGSEKEKALSLDKEVLSWYNSKNDLISKTSLAFRPGPLHRLDRNTSGLLVFSLSLEGARWFSDSIKNHTVQKKYYGLAEGKLSQSQEWEDKLAASESTEEGFHTVSQNNSGNTAQTTARPLACGQLDGKDVTLVEYTIKTGRKHQIRAQSQLHGHPLAGDKAYGGSPAKALKREYYLQAFSLTFPQNNPLNLPPEIKIAPDSDFLRILEYCEIEKPGL